MTGVFLFFFSFSFLTLLWSNATHLKWDFFYTFACMHSCDDVEHCGWFSRVPHTLGNLPSFFFFSFPFAFPLGLLPTLVLVPLCFTELGYTHVHTNTPPSQTATNKVIPPTAPARSIPRFKLEHVYRHFTFML